MSWDNLIRRGWSGPNICILCKHEGESVNHLFVHCTFTKCIWSEIKVALHISEEWGDTPFKDNLEKWYKKVRNHKELPVFICWGVWRTRNYMIFENKSQNSSMVFNRILDVYNESYKEKVFKRNRAIRQPSLIDVIVVGYFDGAALLGQCGGGMCLNLNQSHSFHLWMGSGTGTNTRAKLLALWGLLRFATNIGIVSIQVFGDSKVIVDWGTGCLEMQVPWYVGFREPNLLFLPSLKSLSRIFSGSSTVLQMDCQKRQLVFKQVYFTLRS